MLANSDSQSVSTSMEHNPKTVTACVNCGHRTFTKVLDAYDFDSGEKHFALEKCENCQLVRSSPVLNEAELSSYYDIGYYGSSSKKFHTLLETWTIWSNNRLANKILSITGLKNSGSNEPPRILDIGCGRANLLKAFNRMGCKCYGIERSDFPEDPELNDITLYKQELTKIQFEVASFDVIVIWHVLEHLTNPSVILKDINKLLKPTGSLIVAVPNFGGLQSRLFGKYWFHLDLPRHTYHFDRRSLTFALANSNLQIESIETSCIDQGIYGFIQSAINSLEISKPNTLYSILKQTKSKGGVFPALIQFILAGLLLPFAIAEYIISRVSGTGACLILRATKN